MSDVARTLSIRILDRIIEIRCNSVVGRSLLKHSYGHLQISQANPDLVYSIEDAIDSGLLIRRQSDSIPVQRATDLLLHFDDDLVVQLQHLRPDLYFEHAAVVALDERAYLLPAPSGHGKSTLAWALLHHGLRYLSDELGPIDPKGLTVAPYSRAICLKQNPSPPYEAPFTLTEGQSTLHLPVGCLPLAPIETPIPLTGALFPRFDSTAQVPLIRRISTATAAARLYSNSLNSLAHPGSGLDTALEVASQIQSYELTSSGLGATCELVLQTLNTDS